MNVTNNVNQFVSLYQTALETSGLGNVTVAASEDGKSLTVTMHDANGGVTGTNTIDIPEIDIPSGASVGDSAELTKFIGQIGDTVKTLANLDDETFEQLEKNVSAALEKASADVKSAQTDATAGTSSSTKVSALYCIYKLMALMLEVAREQREAARETRQADTQMMLQAMENQRQAMINEAITGMICCGCVAVIQLGMVGISAYKESQVSTARNDASRITGDKTFKSVAGMAREAGNPQALETAKEKATTNFDKAVDKFVKNKELSPTERQNANEAKQTISQKFETIDSMSEADVKAALGKENATPQEINDYKAKERTKVYEQCKTERTQVRDRFEKAEDEGTLDDKLRKEMDLANAKVEYAAACKLNAEAQPGKAPSVDLVNGFRQQANLDGAKAVNERKTTLTDKISEKQFSAQRTNQITNVFSTLFKGIADHGLELQKAENKKYDQTVALEREKLETTKDLVQNSLDMFKQMLSVLNSILESEKSSFREIMG